MRILFNAAIAILPIIVSGCQEDKKLAEQRRIWQYENWEQDFKDRTLCLCLLKGLNNKSLQDSLTKYDKSFYNPLAVSIFDSTINELLKKEIIQMQKDSADYVGHTPDDLAELIQGRYVMTHCISLHRSERLDSLVKSEKKNWAKIESIDDEVYKNFPAY